MSAEATVVWISGTNWDDVPGTDQRMVLAIAASVHVIWVDPPVGWNPLGGAQPRLMARDVLPGVTRLTITTLPGVTRPVIRSATSWLLSDQIRKLVAARSAHVVATVVAFPLARFPEGIGGIRVLYVTDDWLAGARLMGLSRASVKRILTKNLQRADFVAAVSPQLLEQLSLLVDHRGESVVLPNGCPLPVSDYRPAVRDRVVGLVGQLNERLDLGVLEAVRDTGVAIRVIGPRSHGSAGFERRLDRFLASPNVEWAGAVPGGEVQEHLSRLTLGLTPYVNSAFNRASFPLKTLEYLAAGIPVVSTDLPSSRWLNTPHITLCSEPSDFARAVETALQQPEDTAAALARQDFARLHSWDARAKQFLQLVDQQVSPSPSGDGGNLARERNLS